MQQFNTDNSPKSEGCPLLPEAFNSNKVRGENLKISLELNLGWIWNRWESLVSSKSILEDWSTRYNQRVKFCWGTQFKF